MAQRLNATACDTQKHPDLAPRKRVRCNPMFGGRLFPIIAIVPQK